jgi:hypothetical protein
MCRVGQPRHRRSPRFAELVARAGRLRQAVSRMIEQPRARCRGTAVRAHGLSPRRSGGAQQGAQSLKFVRVSPSPLRSAPLTLALSPAGRGTVYRWERRDTSFHARSDHAKSASDRARSQPWAIMEGREPGEAGQNGEARYVILRSRRALRWTVLVVPPGSGKGAEESTPRLDAGFLGSRRQPGPHRVSMPDSSVFRRQPP